eukprot:8537-Heterococcus_DN1.PRE.1
MTATPTTGTSTATYSSGAFTSSGLSYGGAQCPAGSYCPTGSLTPLPCLDGSYMNHTAAVVCDPCPANFQCAGFGTVTPQACPQGSFCPVSTGLVPQKCPVGTFGAAAGLAATGDCTPCTAGSYCSTVGLSAPTGSCTAGYYCPTGSQVLYVVERKAAAAALLNADGFGKLNATLTSNICPAGSYCPTGSAAPLQCPVGTYVGTTGTPALNNCIVCSDVSAYFTAARLHLRGSA